MRLYEVEIGIDAPEYYKLKAGMSASADIVINERNDILLVPSQAVALDSQGRQVIKV